MNAFKFFLIAIILSLFLSSLEAKKICKKVYKCTKRQRNAEFCTAIYAPVCGHLPDIRCVTTPCNHITYSNSCEACKNPDVKSYTNGECTIKD